MRRSYGLAVMLRVNWVQLFYRLSGLGMVGTLRGRLCAADNYSLKPGPAPSMVRACDGSRPWVTSRHAERDEIEPRPAKPVLLSELRQLQWSGGQRRCEEVAAGGVSGFL